MELAGIFTHGFTHTCDIDNVPTHRLMFLHRTASKWRNSQKVAIRKGPW